MQAHDSDNDDNGDYFNPEEEVAIGDAKNCELPVIFPPKEKRAK